MKELKSILKPLRRKLFLEKAFNIFLVGVSGGLFISALLLLLSKFVYISDRALIIAGIITISAAVSLFYALFKYPSFLDAAAAGDSLGYKERFITAFYVKEGTDVYDLVMKDAVHKAKSGALTKKYRLTIKRSYIKILLLSLAALFICGFVPSPKANVLEERKVLKEKVLEKIKEIDENKEELLKEANPKQAKDTEKIIKELKKELKSAKTEAEALKASQKAQESLKKLAEKPEQKDLKELAESLKSHEATKSLGEALENGNTEEIREEMEALNELLQNASPEDLKEIAEAFNEAAENLSKDNALRENVKNLSNALNSGSISDLNDAWSEYGEIMNQLSQDNPEFKKAVDKFNQTVSGSQSQNENKENNGGQESNSGEGENSGENGQNSQSGQNGQNGQNGNSQSGQNGNGQGQSQGQGNSSGQGSGKGHKENEEIYSRGFQDKAHTDINIEGTVGESGQYEEQTQQTIGEKGEMLPYDQVYGNYKEEALNTLEDYDIPYGMKEIVKDYFTSLE